MKKILDFFKRVFLKKKESFVEIVCDDSRKDIENISIDNELVNVRNINWSLIEKLSSYDIVFVKMSDVGVSKIIDESHKKRPFLVTEKKDAKKIVCGYYLTSNIANRFFSNDKYKGLKIVLDSNKYKLNKNSLLLFNDTINLPYENIIHLIDHINTNDLNKLKKYRSLLCGQTVISNRENKIVEIGDLIFYNGAFYIVYQMDNTNCYGYFICESDDNVDLREDNNYILFNNQLYFIDYQNNKIFNNNEELCIVSRFNDDIVELIKQNKKILKVKRKGKYQNK